MTETTPRGAEDLHPAIWLGLPVGSVALLWLTPLLGFERWKVLMMDESGFIEIATVCFLVPAIVLGVYMFVRRHQLPAGVGVLLLAGAVAALYFAGEETSWGQQYFGYRTPAGWAEVNRQGEFNLHNIELKPYGRWADLVDDLVNEVPRAMMTGATLLGGVILPLALARRRNRPGAKRGFWHWVIPTWRLVPVSLIACFATLPEKVCKKLLRAQVHIDPKSYVNMAFIDPAGEFKEYCFALVILLYMLSIFLRMRARRAATQYEATATTGRPQVHPPGRGGRPR